MVSEETKTPCETFEVAKINHTLTDNARDAHARISISDTPTFGLYLFSQLARENNDVTDLEFMVNLLNLNLS